MRRLTALLRRASATAAAIGAVAVQPDARAIQFNVSGSALQFVPVHDLITEGYLNLGLFQIDSVVDGTGSAVGFEGGFFSKGGPGDFYVGPASAVSGPVPLIETAPLRAFGFLAIFEGGGGASAVLRDPGRATSLYTPIASVAELKIDEGVFPLEDGSFGLNTSDPDLVEFFSGDEVILTFSFSLAPGRTLADLIENGGSAAYSGVLYSEISDSGTTVALLGIGLSGLIGARRWLAK